MAFMSGQGALHKPCMDSCGLNYKGKCAFQILAAKAWKDAGFGYPKKSSEKNEVEDKTTED